MRPAFVGTGLAEIRADEDVALWMVPGFLDVVVGQLAVCGLRRMLWGRVFVMDVYPQELSVQHGVSDD